MDLEMKPFKVKTTGSYLAEYEIWADCLEDAIQKFKDGYDENFYPEFQDDEKVTKVEEMDVADVKDVEM